MLATFPAGPGPAAEALARHMGRMGIVCPLGASAVAGTLVLEPPVRLMGGIRSRGATRIGAFSYSWAPIPPSVRQVGRYCSVAGEVRFGELEHPTNRFSTSSFTYDEGWMWEEFAVRQGRVHRPAPFPEAARNAPITVGNDVWIGLQAYIKGGVRLGDGCIVGARAVVTRDVPPYAVVAGNPARVIRFRFDEDTVAALLELRWWRHAFVDFAGLAAENVEAMIAGITRLRSEGAVAAYAPACLRLSAGRREAEQ